MTRLSATLSLMALIALSGFPAGAAAAGFTVRTLSPGGRVLDADRLEGPRSGPPVLACLHWEGSGRMTLYHAVTGKVLSTGAAPAGAAAFDLADVDGDGTDEILFITPEAVLVQETAAGKLEGRATSLFSGTTFFPAPQAGSMPRIQLAHDFTGDGKADLFIPRPHGYEVILWGHGDPDHKSLAVKGRNRMIRMAHEIFQLNYVAQNWSLPRALPADFNGDGKPDLVALQSKKLLIHLGAGSEGFPEKPSHVVPLGFLESSVDDVEEDSFEGRRLFLEDIDGDGPADLIVVRTQGKVGLFSSIRTRIELFRGRRDAFYPPFPDRLLTVPGVGVQPEFVDIDGDKRLDLVVPALRTDILSGVQTAVTKEVTLTYDIFACADDGLWETSPAFEENAVLPTGDMEEGRAVPGAAFSGDFDGDGQKDRLVVATGAVQVHRGLPGFRFAFSNDPYMKAKAATSNDFRVRDFDGDRRDDVLFFHGTDIVLVLSGEDR